MGDPGFGKTMFTRKIAYDMAKQHLDNPESPVPIRIDLKGCGSFADLDGIVMNHFMVNKMNVSPRVFEYLMSQGRLILILDGFDEMSLFGDDDTNLRTFKILNQAVEGKPLARMIITSRANYFKTDESVRALISNTSDLQVVSSEAGTNLYKTVAKKSNYLLSFIKEFDENQIQTFLNQVSGSKANEYFAIIKKTYNLEELARRPILLDMIVKSLPELIQKKEKITATDLYETYTEMWIQRDAWRVTKTAKGRAKFAQELAWSIWTTDEKRIHWSQIPAYIRDYYSDVIRTTTDLEFADQEVRTASFLTRDPKGDYGFAHKSFMEFFLAKLFAEEISTGEARRFGKVTLSPEIMFFLKDLIREPSSLIKLILETRKNVLGFGVNLGRNCITMLSICGYLPVNDDLSETRLGGGNLKGANMQGMKLKGCDLSDTVFAEANLERADLSGAVLSRCDFTSANLIGASLNGADLTKVRMTSAQLKNCDMRNAFLKETDVSEAQLKEAIR
jgi:hypothetical protein